MPVRRWQKGRTGFFLPLLAGCHGAMKMGKQPPGVPQNGHGVAQDGQSQVGEGKPPQFFEFNPYMEYDELADWSRQVKIKAGWACEVPNCGELDKKLLESHHIKPKEMFPELAEDLDNGECLCIYHHAVKHWHNEAVRNKILARLAIIYQSRYGAKVT